MNVRLLKKVKARIRKDWKHTDIFTFTDYTPECGTTYCIGGWAVILSHPQYPMWGSIESKAREVLELSAEESQRLFYCGEWPVQFCGKKRRHRHDFFLAPTKTQVLARIDHFIATDGKE